MLQKTRVDEDDREDPICIILVARQFGMKNYILHQFIFLKNVLDMSNHWI